MATDSVVGAAADSSVEYAPAAVRNREVLTDALRTALASAERLYEVGAGTGCHTAFLADTFPDLLIQPTDLEVSCWHRCVVAVHFVGLSVFCVPLTHYLSLSLCGDPCSGDRCRHNRPSCGSPSERGAACCV